MGVEYRLQHTITVDELTRIQKELKKFLSENGTEDFMFMKNQKIDYVEFVTNGLQLIGVLLGRQDRIPESSEEAGISGISWNISSIDLIIVHKDYQNKGIGKKLIRNFISRVKHPIVVYTCENYGYYIYDKLGFKHQSDYTTNEGHQGLMYTFISEQVG
jgi:GNAT superfamily N-acetyltransferase